MSPMVWVDDEEANVKVKVTDGFFSDQHGGDVPAGTVLSVTPSLAGRWDRIGIAERLDDDEPDPEALKAAGRARRGGRAGASEAAEDQRPRATRQSRSQQQEEKPSAGAMEGERGGQLQTGGNANLEDLSSLESTTEKPSGFISTEGRDAGKPNS